jgi:hypothetical protein
MRMPDFEHEIVAEWDKIVHHRKPAVTGPNPVIIEATTDVADRRGATTMTLTAISDDVKTDLTEGITYVEGLVQRLKTAAPGIISTSEAVANSTVGKLAEALAGAVIPAPYEEIAVSFVKDLAAKYGAATVTPAVTPAPAAATPVQAATAG